MSNSNAQNASLVRWRNFNDEELFFVKVVNLLNISGLRMLIDTTHITEECLGFIKSLKKSFDNCNSGQQIRSTYDKAKRETAMLESRLDLISQAVSSPDFEYVKVCNKYNETFTRVSSNDYIYIKTMYDDEEDIRLFGYHDPKAYTHLYKAIKLILNQVNGRDEDEQIRILAALESFILTLCHLYDDIEADCLIDELEQEAFESMIQDPLPMGQELLGLLSELKMDMDMPRPPMYVRQFLNYCREAQSRFRYDRTKMHISSSSSGTYLIDESKRGRGSRWTCPSFMSSSFEVDNLKQRPEIAYLDRLTGFPLDLYPSEEEVDTLLHSIDRSLDTHPITTMYIKQHKLKRRCIHMAQNPTQDRLAMFRNALKPASAMYLNSDSAKDQEIGRLRSLKLSQKAFDEGYVVHCCDIHDATGTNSVEFQEECLSIVFEDRQIAKAFTTLTQQMRFNKFSRNKKKNGYYVAFRGQPQGTEPSFDGLTLMHYVVFLLVMIRLGLKNMRPEEFFIICGDDSVVYAKPQYIEGWREWETESGHDDLLFSTYRHIASLIGWDVHPSKGYHFNPSYDTACTVEFCKQAYLGGHLKSAMPLELFGQCDTAQGVIALLLWYARPTVSGSISLNRFFELLAQCGITLSPSQNVYVTMCAVAGSGIPNNAFQHLQVSERVREMYSPYMQWFRAYDIIEGLKRILDVSKIKSRDEKACFSFRRQDGKTYHMNRDAAKLEDAILEHGLNVGHGKIIDLYDQNLDCIEILSRVSDISESDTLYLISSWKDSQDLLAIRRFIRFMEFSIDDPLWYTYIPYQSLVDAKKAIDNLQPYSYSKRARTTGEMIISPPENFTLCLQEQRASFR